MRVKKPKNVKNNVENFINRTKVEQQNSIPLSENTSMPVCQDTDILVKQHTSKLACQQTGIPANNIKAKYKKATYYIRPELIKKLKLLSVETERDLSNLMNEAIELLLKKYKQ